MSSCLKNISKNTLFLTFTAVIFSGYCLNVQAQYSEDFFRITNSKVEVVDVSPTEYQNVMKLMGNQHISCQDSNLAGIFDTGNGSPLTPFKDLTEDVSDIVDEGNKIVDGLINIGSKIWTIVKAGKPVINLNIGPSANALPQGVKCWDELETWQVPNVFRVKTQFDNAFGFALVRFQFDVVFTYGGSLNGKGKYLTHVQVFPSDVYAFWMQEFNASVEVASLVNIGTKADPIAAMQVDVQWQVKNFLNEAQETASIFVTGEGASKSLY